MLFRSDSGGTIWVEPLTGMVVDLEDHGVSAWADPATGIRTAEFHRWDTRMAPESRIRQVEMARKAVSNQVLIEERFPGAVALVGILFGGIGLIWRSFR